MHNFPHKGKASFFKKVRKASGYYAEEYKQVKMRQREREITFILKYMVIYIWMYHTKLNKQDNKQSCKGFHTMVVFIYPFIYLLNLSFLVSYFSSRTG